MLKNIFKFLVFIFILFLVFLSDSQWCYLFVIILICLSTELIDTKIINTLKDCLAAYGKQVYNLSTSEIEEKNKENQEKLDKDTQELTGIKIEDLGWKQFITEGQLNYKNIEKQAILYLSKTSGVDFEMYKEIKGVNANLLPDGIKLYKNCDKLAEIKVFTGNNEDLICSRSVSSLRSYYSFYERNYSKRNVTFYFLIIVNDTFEQNKLMTLQRMIKMDFVKYNINRTDICDLNLSIITASELETFVKIL